MATFSSLRRPSTRSTLSNTGCRQRSDYLGQFGTDDGAASDAGWRITLEGAGTAVHPDNRDGNIMTINGYVIDGRLGFTFVTKLGQSTADSMVRRYRELLVELVDGLS